MLFVNSNSDSLWRLSFFLFRLKMKRNIEILLIHYGFYCYCDETIGAKIEKLFTNIKIRLLTYCFVSYDIFFENLLSHRITISQRISFKLFFFFYTFDYYCLLFDCAIRKTKVKYQVFTMKFRNIL